MVLDKCRHQAKMKITAKQGAPLPIFLKQQHNALRCLPLDLSGQQGQAEGARLVAPEFVGSACNQTFRCALSVPPGSPATSCKSPGDGGATAIPPGECSPPNEDWTMTGFVLRTEAPRGQGFAQRELDVSGKGGERGGRAEEETDKSAGKERNLLEPSGLRA